MGAIEVNQKIHQALIELADAINKLASEFPDQVKNEVAVENVLDHEKPERIGRMLTDCFHTFAAANDTAFRKIWQALTEYGAEAQALFNTKPRGNA